MGKSGGSFGKENYKNMVEKSVEIMKHIKKRLLVSSLLVALLATSNVSNQEVSATDSGFSGELAISDYVKSESMETALPIYEKAIQTLEFHQLGSADWTGASLEEVKLAIDADVEPYVATIDGSLDFKMLLYPFGTAGLDAAEMGFLFAEDHLVFAGLGNLMANFDGKELFGKEQADRYAQAGVALSEILADSPKLKAFAHVSFDNQDRDMIAIDVGEDLTTGKTYFYFLEDGVVQDADTMSIFEAMQGLQTTMFDKLVFQYTDGAVGSAVNEPVALDAVTVESDLGVDPLEKLMTGTTVTNPKFVEAWQAYQLALSELAFRDLASDKLLGSKIQDVEQSFAAGIEANRVDFSQAPVSLLVYTFEDSKINPATGQPDVGEMALYFVDDLLAFASVASRSFLIEEDRVMSSELLSSSVTDEISIDELASYNPQVISMGYMYQNEAPRSVVALQTGDAKVNQQVSFLFIREELVRGGEVYDMAEVLQDVQTAMFYSLGDFFVDEARELNN